MYLMNGEVAGLYSDAHPPKVKSKNEIKKS